jgi:phage/plasmid-associated DNA primase
MVGYSQWIEGFKEESAGILNWLVEGFQMYSKGYLQDDKVPQIVIDETNKYRKSNDELDSWIQDCNITNDYDSYLKVEDAYNNYVEWFRTNEAGKGCPTKLDFKKLLIERFGEEKVYKVSGKTIRAIKGWNLGLIKSKSTSNVIDFE